MAANERPYQAGIQTSLLTPGLFLGGVIFFHPRIMIPAFKAHYMVLFPCTEVF